MSYEGNVWQTDNTCDVYEQWHSPFKLHSPRLRNMYKSMHGTKPTADGGCYTARENGRKCNAGYGVKYEGGEDDTVGEDGADVFMWHAEDRGCAAYKMLKFFRRSYSRAGVPCATCRTTYRPCAFHSVWSDRPSRSKIVVGNFN